MFKEQKKRLLVSNIFLEIARFSVYAFFFSIILMAILENIESSATKELPIYIWLLIIVGLASSITGYIIENGAIAYFISLTDNVKNIGGYKCEWSYDSIVKNTNWPEVSKRLISSGFNNPCPKDKGRSIRELCKLTGVIILEDGLVIHCKITFFCDTYSESKNEYMLMKFSCGNIKNATMINNINFLEGTVLRHMKKFLP